MFLKVISVAGALSVPAIEVAAQTPEDLNPLAVDQAALSQGEPAGGAEAEKAVPADVVPEDGEPKGQVEADTVVRDVFEGREELGDIWNSASVYAEGGIEGVDVTKKIVIEEIIEPAGDYRYSAFGKPDPFQPPFEIFANLAPVAEASQNSIRPASPLGGIEIPIVSPLQTDLENLAVIGMWQLDDGTRKALIMNRSNQGVIAQVGDPIGLYGKIISIKPEGVLSRQYTLKVDGSRTYEDALLLFGDKEEIIESQIGSKVILKPGEGSRVKANGPPIVGTTPNNQARTTGQSTAPTALNDASNPVPTQEQPQQNNGLSAPGLNQQEAAAVQQNPGDSEQVRGLVGGEAGQGVLATQGVPAAQGVPATQGSESLQGAQPNPAGFTPQQAGALASPNNVVPPVAGVMTLPPGEIAPATTKSSLPGEIQAVPPPPDSVFNQTIPASPPTQQTGR